MSRITKLRALGSVLDELFHTVDQFNEKAARHAGLHSTDIRCLDYLRRAGHSAAPKAIVAELGIRPSTGTALLDRLETNGFIRRVSNPEDRRSVLIELVDDHEEYTLSLVRQVTESFEVEMSGYSDNELTFLQKFLEKMKALAQRGVDALDETESRS